MATLEIKRKAKVMPVQRMSLEAALQEAREEYRGEFASAPLITFFKKRGFPIRISTSSDVLGIGEIFLINDAESGVNGIVIDAVRDFSIVARPLPETTIDTGAVQYCLRSSESYDIYQAIDGTRVLIYYLPRFERWMIATTHMYDARNAQWIGPKKYEDIISECWEAQCGRPFSWDALDRAAQYEIIFHHPNFHPLSEEMHVWQLSGPAIPGLIPYESLLVCDIGGEVPTEANMRRVAEGAYDNYLRSKEAMFGYIFRRKVATADIPVAAFYESTLHRFVRQQIYDIPQHIVGLTFRTRELYQHVRAYLEVSRRDAHVAMFARAVDVFRKMDFIIEALTAITTDEMRANKTDATRSVAMRANHDALGAQLFGGGSSSWERVRERLITIGVRAGRYLLEQHAMRPFSEHIRRNVSDQYRGMQNLNEFVEIIALA